MSMLPITGLPGLRGLKTANHRTIFLQSGPLVNLAGGRYISGGASRDPSNGDPTRLQAGLVMGKIGSVVNSLGTVGFYAPSILGVLNGALTSTGTTVTAIAAAITEIVRRCGATGTFKITGPPTASGVVRTLTATYSAASGTTATIAALGVNEVQRVDFNIAATGGNIVLKIPKADGTFVLTTPSAWSATDATFLSNLNTVLDVASGVAGGIVATAIPSVDTDLGFILTFSGTGYAALPANGLVTVETLPTSSTSAKVTRSTLGVDGRFVTASFIQPTDGSETPVIMLPDEYPMSATDNDGTNQDQPFPAMPVEAVVESSKLINWPADASLRTWLQQQLSTAAAGKYVFDNVY